MNKFFDFLVSPIFGGEYNLEVGILSAIFGVVVYCVYILYCYLMFGISKSISYTFYLLLKEKVKHPLKRVKNIRFLFQLFMYISAACLFGIAQNGWYLITAICFVIMAFFPSVEYKNFIVPHCTFASLGIGLGLIGLPVCFNNWLVILCVAAFVSSLLILLCCNQRPTEWDGESDETTKLYWIENTCIPIMIIGLIIGSFILY